MVNGSEAVVRCDSVAVDFDDERLIANAGLLLTSTLSGRLGIERLVDETVGLGERAGAARPGRKLLALMHAIGRAWSAGAGPGSGRLVIDIDSFVGEVHGYESRASALPTQAGAATTRWSPRARGPGRCCTVRQRKGQAGSGRGAFRFRAGARRRGQARGRHGRDPRARRLGVLAPRG